MRFFETAKLADAIEEKGRPSEEGRLKDSANLRHNCPNTMRKQASDGLGLCIASLL